MFNNKVFVYATDNELLTLEEVPGFNRTNQSSLMKNADILVADCQYTEEEYKSRTGWGHSTIERVIDIARETGVKKLYAFHHDPNHSDEEIDAIVKKGKGLAGQSLKVYGAREGMTLTL